MKGGFGSAAVAKDAVAVSERPFGAFGSGIRETMRQGWRMICRTGQAPGLVDPLPRCRNPVPVRGIVLPPHARRAESMFVARAFGDEGRMKFDQTVRYGLLLQLVKTVLASDP